MIERGSNAHHLIVRLAIEGMPVRAICRVLYRDADYVRDVLTLAVARGTLAKLPVDEWPSGGKRESDAGPIPYERILPLAQEIQIYFDFTPQVSTFVAGMIHLDPAPRSQLKQLISRKAEASEKLVDVVACKARAALAPHDVLFDLVWAFGYRMSPANRDRFLVLLDIKRCAGREASRAA